MQRCCWGLVFWLVSGVAFADTFEVTEGMDLKAVLGSLSAGDEVIIHEGTYVTGGRWGLTWIGTESRTWASRAIAAVAGATATRS